MSLKKKKSTSICRINDALIAPHNPTDHRINLPLAPTSTLSEGTLTLKIPPLPALARPRRALSLFRSLVLRKPDSLFEIMKALHSLM